MVEATVGTASMLKLIVPLDTMVPPVRPTPAVRLVTAAPSRKLAFVVLNVSEPLKNASWSVDVEAPVGRPAISSEIDPTPTMGFSEIPVDKPVPIVIEVTVPIPGVPARKFDFVSCFITPSLTS
jgi:hypothetical protein